MKRSRWFYLVALASAMALVGAACGGDGDTPAGDGDEIDCEWVIGTMGALSGDYASVGQPIADGVQYAIDQANEAGDVPCELSLQSEDSQGDPNQAPPLARSLTDNDLLVGCVCPYFSGETLATGQIFSRAGIAITGTGTNATIDEQGYETWFRGVAPDNIQGEVAGQYIAAQGVSKVAVIHDNQDYSKGLADEVFAALGDIAVGPFIITPGETDYSAVVAQVSGESPDFIFYGGYTPEAGPLAKQLFEAGVTVPFMTDDGAKDPTFGELAGRRAAENGLASCPCVDPLKIDAAQSFVDGMREQYGENAPGTFAADMFDVTNVIIDALRTLNGDEDIDTVRQAVVDYFDNADGIQGVAKSYSWNDDGEFEGGPGDIWIYEWSNDEGNFVSLGPAEDLI